MAAVITMSDIRELKKPIAREPSQLQASAAKAERMARAVENEWHHLPEDVKDSLAALAYELIEPPKGFAALKYRLSGGLILGWVWITGQQHAVLSFHAALNRLISAILFAIEQDNPRYRAQMDKLLEAASQEVTIDVTIAEDDFDAWLNTVSEEALREL